MPIRRPRTPRPALRHVAFLEAMATRAPDDPAYRAAQAVFLVLRLIDQWVAFGAPMTAPASRALAATRREVEALAPDDDLRAPLLAVLDAVAAMPTPDPQPVLQRLFAVGLLLEPRGRLTEAGDIHRMVSRLADPAVHPDLAYESLMRSGACLRETGEHDWADQAYAGAAMLATRDRDRVRVILARRGRASVLRARGNLPAADDAIEQLITDSEQVQSATVTALLLHDRATLAWARDDRAGAVRAAFRAFDLAPDGPDRERILADVARYLETIGATDAARVARGVLESSRLALTRPTRRSAESDRATAIELARVVAQALRDHEGGGA